MLHFVYLSVGLPPAFQHSGAVGYYIHSILPMWALILQPNSCPEVGVGKCYGVCLLHTIPISRQQSISSVISMLMA